MGCKRKSVMPALVALVAAMAFLIGPVAGIETVTFGGDGSRGELPPMAPAMFVASLGAHQHGVGLVDTIEAIDRAWANRIEDVLASAAGDGHPIAAMVVGGIGSHTASHDAYIRSLFDRWRLSPDHTLVVLDVDGRKLRVKAGSAAKAVLCAEASTAIVKRFAKPILAENRFGEGLLAAAVGLADRLRDATPCGSGIEADQKWVKGLVIAAFAVPACGLIMWYDDCSRRRRRDFEAQLARIKADLTPATTRTANLRLGEAAAALRREYPSLYKLYKVDLGQSNSASGPGRRPMGVTLAATGGRRTKVAAGNGRGGRNQGELQPEMWRIITWEVPAVANGGGGSNSGGWSGGGSVGGCSF